MEAIVTTNVTLSGATVQIMKGMTTTAKDVNYDNKLQSSRVCWLEMHSILQSLALIE